MMEAKVVEERRLVAVRERGGASNYNRAPSASSSSTRKVADPAFDFGSRLDENGDGPNSKNGSNATEMPRLLDDENRGGQEFDFTGGANIGGGSRFFTADIHQCSC
jgi:hypothetical protein